MSTSNSVSNSALNSRRGSTTSSGASTPRKHWLYSNPTTMSIKEIKSKLEKLGIPIPEGNYSKFYYVSLVVTHFPDAVNN